MNIHMYKVYSQALEGCISHCLQGFPAASRGETEPGLLSGDCPWKKNNVSPFCLNVQREQEELCTCALPSAGTSHWG